MRIRFSHCTTGLCMFNGAYPVRRTLNGLSSLPQALSVNWRAALILEELAGAAEEADGVVEADGLHVGYSVLVGRTDPFDCALHAARSIPEEPGVWIVRLAAENLDCSGQPACKFFQILLVLVLGLAQIQYITS